MPTVPYVKQTWTDGVSSASAARFGVLETGIHEVSLAPAVRVYHNANQSIATGTTTALAFNSERFDTCAGAADTQHDVTTNNSRLTCRYAGKYLITGCVEFEAATGGVYRQVMIRVNAATVIARVLTPPSATFGYAKEDICTLYDLAVNDYVELCVDHDRGSALNVTVQGNASPEFMMVRVA